MRSTTREILAGTTAGAFLVGTTAMTALGAVPSIVLSVGVYLGLRLLVPRDPEPGEEEVAAGVRRAELDAAVARVLEAAGQFEESARKVTSSRVARELVATAATMREMAVDFRTDPLDLRMAREFLDLHLPRALHLVERYVWLASRSDPGEEGRREIERCESTIVRIREAFATQLQRLLENDLEAFRVDRRVFEELLLPDAESDETGVPEPGKEGA